MSAASWNAEIQAFVAVGLLILAILTCAFLVKRLWTILLIEIAAVVLAIIAGFVLFEDIATRVWVGLHAVMADDAFNSFIGLLAVGGGIAGIALLQTAALDTAANAFLDLRSRYHSDEMGNAIKLLVEFAWPVKEAQIRLWRRRLDSDDFQTLAEMLKPQREPLSPRERDELKRAVRRVSSYFDDVAFLYRQRIIDKPTTLSFVELSGLNIFYEVCIPLHLIDNKSAPSIKNARLLRTVMKQQGSGMVKY